MKTTSARRRGVVALFIAMSVGGCGMVSGKTVVRKDAPNFLVADDGSICVVSQERFDKTEVGMKALCAWRGRTTQFIAPKQRTVPAQSSS
jgi:hypothetical protein